MAARWGRWPRTCRACRGQGVRFVSLLGSLTRHAAANPFDVIHKLTEITGAESYFMPAPFFADSLEDKQVLMGAARSRSRCSSWLGAAELVVVGIGEVVLDVFALAAPAA